MRTRNIPAQILSAKAPRANDVRRLLNLLLSLLVLCANLLHAQVSKHLPIYDAQEKVVYGKVRMADGGSLPELVTMEAICGGVAYPVAVTDTAGVPIGGLAKSNFRIRENGKPQSITNFDAASNLPISVGLLIDHVSPRAAVGLGGASAVVAGLVLLRVLRPASRVVVG